MPNTSEIQASPGKRPPRRTIILAATIVNATFVLIVQLLALLTLGPSDFGAFSMQYLVFAEAGSLALSIVCEPWLRTDLHHGHVSSWADYSSNLLYLAITAGIATAILSIFVPQLHGIAITGGLAVLAGTYRGGARYFEVRRRAWTRVLFSDSAGLITTIGAWTGFRVAGINDLAGIALAWFIGNTFSAAIAPVPRLRGIRSVTYWIRTHRSAISPLLRDSILMDISSVGTPFAVAPVLGVRDFGVYRAVSNVAAPVRLVLNPLRPTLASGRVRSLLSTKRITLAIGLSLAFGLASYIVLMLLQMSGIKAGSLDSLSEYSIPTAIFVTANFFGHYNYIIARAHANGRALLAGRITQTVLGVGIPILCAVFWGLSGAIWGYAITTCVTACTWFGLVMIARSGEQIVRAAVV